MIARMIVTCAATLSLLFSGSPSAQAVTSELVDVEPAQVRVAVPAPGHSSEWNMTVTNTSAMPVPLALAVTGEGDRALFDGATPLEVTLTDGTGDVLAESVPLGAVLGTEHHLPELPAGETYTLMGHLALPRVAGDEYQGLSGSLVFAYTATQSAPEGPDVPGVPETVTPIELAITGAAPLLALLLGALLIAGGVTLVLTRKRTQR
ncbi:hypothetical protein [Leucobacter chromiireducens]|uniref:hypothetical protein n=1 Tax=Leucobacter chromiireducens TaxID=283877 RepID=UPI000F638425|nr:hypothetical protein [Leucobacter chromiireducens]